MYLDSWFSFYLSSVANQLPFMPECLRSTVKEEATWLRHLFLLT